MQPAFLDFDELHAEMAQFQGAVAPTLLVTFDGRNFMPIVPLSEGEQIDIISRINELFTVNLEKRVVRAHNPELVERVRQEAADQNLEVELVEDEEDFREELEEAYEVMVEIAMLSIGAEEDAVVTTDAVERAYPSHFAPLLIRLAGTEWSVELTAEVQNTLKLVAAALTEQEKHHIIMRSLQKWAKMLDEQALQSLIEHVRREVRKGEQQKDELKTDAVDHQTKEKLMVELEKVIEISITDGQVSVSAARGAAGKSSETLVRGAAAAAA